MKTKTLAVLLGLLGLAQMAGHAAGWPALRGIAAATTASPAPKVFSAVRGLETYSTDFFIEWIDSSGTPRSVELTPEVYTRVRGPYNRRNAYGAVIAYGPIFSTDPATRPLFDGVARYALCGDAPLLVELGIDPATVAGNVRVRLEPIATSNPVDLPLVFEAPCAEAAIPRAS